MARFLVEISTSISTEFECDPLRGEAMQIAGLPNGDAIVIQPHVAVAAMEQGVPLTMRVDGSAEGQVYIVSVRHIPGLVVPGNGVNGG